MSTPIKVECVCGDTWTFIRGTVESCPHCGTVYVSHRDRDEDKDDLLLPDKWQDYWRSVISKGQKLHDKTKVYDMIARLRIDPLKDMVLLSTSFLHQFKRDAQAQYKFYDALGMWIVAKEYWSKEDLNFLEVLVKKYLELWGLEGQVAS